MKLVFAILLLGLAACSIDKTERPETAQPFMVITVKLTPVQAAEMLALVKPVPMAEIIRSEIRATLKQDATNK